MSNDTREIIRLRKIIFLALFLCVVVFSSLAVYFWYRVQNVAESGSSTDQEDTERLIRRVSELIALPDDEQPTVATVANPDVLRDQPFFSRAKRGDKILIYEKAKKAVLYDPDQNKIIEVAPLNLGGNITQ